MLTPVAVRKGCRPDPGRCRRFAIVPVRATRRQRHPGPRCGRAPPTATHGGAKHSPGSPRQRPRAKRLASGNTLPGRHRSGPRPYSFARGRDAARSQRPQRGGRRGGGGRGVTLRQRVCLSSTVALAPPPQSRAPGPPDAAAVSRTPCEPFRRCDRPGRRRHACAHFRGNLPATRYTDFDQSRGGHRVATEWGRAGAGRGGTGCTCADPIRNTNTGLFHTKRQSRLPTRIEGKRQEEAPQASRTEKGGAPRSTSPPPPSRRKQLDFRLQPHSKARRAGNIELRRARTFRRPRAASIRTILK